MKNNELQRIKTINQYHQLMGLPSPEHPLISVIDSELVVNLQGNGSLSFVFDFYAIAIKRNFKGKMRYGQQEYDFDEGVMSFVAPGQVFSIENDVSAPLNATLILVHPDFFWGTSLAKNIKKYEFFEYSTNEALFLSEKEEKIITGIVAIIKQEYQSNIDKFSHDLIIAQLELLLIYSDRFYNRQFLTRKKSNHILIDQFEEVLNKYINSSMIIENGLPTVQYVSDSLHVTPGYLSKMLKTLTGQSTQQHIHEKLIEKAKEKLSTTQASISEIAYELGFEHPQSFSKLFKTKTKTSPLKFRQSFN
ncbi:helix-turn-helix transcriptional regulator [Carboxylicivirga sp. A043]|uniref:helix-turn-helix domain-containing protein n=1 Tax=Carboxylicivirga litoralis TaxID=2816963 RepID=UPI0021CB5FC1|nr:response regulator transcription factor [Carboxylicivirga sp. A043]MCU4156603.1 helix-turn-helix transcriptional regulator [Carboxylicivirga sp. A043]